MCLGRPSCMKELHARPPAAAGSGAAERLEPVADRGGAELPERVLLDLAYALACQAQAPPDRVERITRAVHHAEAQLEHQLLARCEHLGHRALGLLGEERRVD